MKLVLPWDKRTSVYDRVSTLTSVSLLLIVLGISMFVAGIGLGWFIGAVGAVVFAGVHPKCPRCGKSALRQALLSPGSRFYHLWQANRLWPEPVCSQCGLNLTVVQGVHADE